MKYSTTAGAVLLALAFAITSAPGASADYRPGYKSGKKVSAKKRRAPQVAGFRLRGGYRDGLEFEPYVRYNDGNYGNYPNFENRTFSERVFGDTRQ